MEGTALAQALKGQHSPKCYSCGKNRDYARVCRFCWAQRFQSRWGKGKGYFPYDEQQDAYNNEQYEWDFGDESYGNDWSGDCSGYGGDNG